MCFSATAEDAARFAAEVVERFPNEVQKATVVRAKQPAGFLPTVGIEVLVVALGDPEELRPKVQELVSEYVMRDDIWVEVRVVEGTAASDLTLTRGAVQA